MKFIWLHVWYTTLAFHENKLTLDHLQWLFVDQYCLLTQNGEFWLVRNNLVPTICSFDLHRDVDMAGTRLVFS